MNRIAPCLALRGGAAARASSIVIEVGIACLVLATGALAQTPAYTEHLLPPGWAWPPTLGAGHFGRAESAQITEDLVEDVILLRGPDEALPGLHHMAVMVYGPSDYQALCPIQEGVLDFAILRGAGPEGRDAVALVTPGGVVVATVGNDANAFLLTSLSLPSFGSARRLRAADLDGDHDCDLAALASDGLSIVTATQDLGVFTPGPSFALADVATDFELNGDADADGAELAIINVRGLLFAAVTWSPATLTPLRQYRSALYGEGCILDRLCSIAGGGEETPKIGWLTRGLGLGEQLLLVLDAVAYEQWPVLFPWFDARTIVAADVDGDGDREALLTHTAESGVLLMMSDATQSGTSFSNGLEESEQLVPQGVTATLEPDQGAWPVVTDLDNDGDRDLFIACEAAKKLAMIDGHDLPGGGIQSLVPGADAEPPSIMGAIYMNDNGFPDFPVSPGRMSVHVLVDSSLDSAIKVQLIVWRQDDLLSEVSPDAVETYREDLPLPPPDQHIVSFNVDLSDGPDPLHPGEQEVYPFNAVYWCEVRYVEMNANDHVAISYPARVYAYAESVPDTTLHGGPSLPTLLAGVPPETVESCLFPSTSGGGTGEGESGTLFAGAVQCGGFVPKASVPFFPTGGGVPRPNGSGGSGGTGGP